MKAKALAVLIPALFLSTAAFAQSSTTPRDPATREPSKEAAPNDAKGSGTTSVPSAQDRASNREAVSDTALTGKVKSALAADVGLKTVTSIDVDSDKGGVVTLKGKVDCQIPADSSAALAAVNFGKPISEAAPNSGIVKALRPLVAGLDQPGGGERDAGKASSLLARFGQRLKKK